MTDVNQPIRDTLIERKAEEVLALAVELKQFTDETHVVINECHCVIADAMQKRRELDELVRVKQDAIKAAKEKLDKKRDAYNTQALNLADVIYGCAQR